MTGTLPFDDDHPREECAVFGIYGTEDAATHAVLGLHAMQHRGQEAAGIVVSDGVQFHAHREAGLVGDIFSDENIVRELKGRMAIGHTRYSTTGAPSRRNVQPLFADLSFGGFAIAHNGNLTNAVTLRNQLVEEGCIFQSTTDTENIVHLMATGRGGVVERIVDALRQVVGAYSLVALTRDNVIGLRDPLGVRPLVLGRLGEAYILASETCGLDIIGAEFVRDIEAGELVVLDENGVTSHRVFPSSPSRFCVFEYIYFARPDSFVEGRSVYEARKQIGRELAREAPAEADLVVPIPDSGVPAALGYAEEAGLPIDMGITRNHYVGRTFIEPESRIRHLGVRLKHNANSSYLRDRRVVLVDDSIVRGTTSSKIVEMVRGAGAAEIHMRISSPPTTHSCFYGVDTPQRADLLAAGHDVEGMRRFIGADSLAFVSLDGLYRATAETERDGESPQYCDACFSGEYPIRLIDKAGGPPPHQLSLLASHG